MRREDKAAGRLFDCACDTTPNVAVGTVLFVLSAPVTISYEVTAQDVPLVLARFFPFRQRFPPLRLLAHFRANYVSHIQKVNSAVWSLFRAASRIFMRIGGRMSFTARLGHTGVVLVFAVRAMTIGTASAQAEIFGTVQGVVHDPQHRPIEA